jgi:hypothetical protein
MKVLCMTREQFEDHTAKLDITRADVAIMDGIVIKNREGTHGGKIGRAIYIWEEEKVQNPAIPVQ